jgi:hypothetical protein
MIVPSLSRPMARSLRQLVARTFPCLALAAVLCVPSPALADDAADRRVEELKTRGNQAMLDLNYAEALEAYKAAVAIAPDNATLYYNLGRAHQAREDYPSALDALEQFSAKASPEVKGRVPTLAQLILDVRSRVAALTVKCSADVPNATVTIAEKTTVNGCTTTPAPVRISVPARNAVVEVRFAAEGYQDQTVRIPVDGGGPVVPVSLSVLPKVATRAVPVEPKREAPLTSRWWFWTGAGILATGVGITIWYLVAQPESEASKGSIEPGQVSAPLLRF